MNDKILSSIDINEYKEKFLQEILKIKNKYLDTEISNIALIYETNIVEISNIKELEKQRKEFYEIINKLKKEIILPDLKAKQKEWIISLGKGHEKDITELTKKYLDLNEKCNSLEELNSLKQKYAYEYNHLLEIEIQLKKEFIGFKDRVKISLLNQFYKYAYNENLSSIVLRYNLLLSMLSLLEVSSIETMEDIYNLIRGVDYNNMQEECQKFNLLALQYNPKTTVIEYQEAKDKIENDIIIDVPLENEKQKLVNRILESLYTKYTSKNTSIEKIKKDKEKFVNLLKMVAASPLEIVKKALCYQEDNWKMYLMILESIPDFSNLNKLYIERDTGNICILKEYGKNVYTIYLNGTIDKNIKDKNQIIWKYIPLLNFFRLAYYTNGKMLKEISNKKEIIVFDYYANDLYFTNDLLLRYIETEDKKQFVFLPSKERFHFVLTDDIQMSKSNNFLKYQNRDDCLKDLLSFIIDEQKELVNEKSL